MQCSHLSIKGVFSVSTRSVTEEAHRVWQEVSIESSTMEVLELSTMEVVELSTMEVVEATDSQSVRQDIVDSDLIMKENAQV